jgi:predicted enzyme involved in methoxymalonyl-ACP biosynthesis
MHDMLSDLLWLPRTPADFGERCRAAREASGDAGASICELASFGLDTSQLIRLAKTIERIQSRGRTLDPLVPFRLGLLGNGTLAVIRPAICASAARHGVAVECMTAEYDQVMQVALTPDSAFNRAKPDAVLLALDFRAFPLHITPGDPQAADEAVEEWLSSLSAIHDAMRKHTGATCIFQTLAPPPERLFGHYDRQLPGTELYLIDAINRGIAAMATESGAPLLDVASLAETVGLANWHAPSQWNMAKLPFATEFVPLYADHVARLIGALCGKSRKCLVLDLDNTVWGGVVGDDGMAGIQIAQGDPTGEAHRSVQRLALALRDRGIVLAVA